MTAKSLIAECLEQLIKKVEIEKRALTNRELLEFCKPAGEVLKGTIDPHFCHEIAEAAINRLIQQKYARVLLREQSAPLEMLNEIIKPIDTRLPTESWRSREQNVWQQFSTPPAIGYLLAYLLNLGEQTQVLEPSAGTGSLAVWSSGLGLVTHTNEIDSRRRFLLRELGFKPTSYNAEFIDDFLPPEIKADCLMMNPPFSANSERTRRNSSKFGFRHVESAIKRLEAGGKFGIILGSFAQVSTKTGNDFWEKMSDKLSVKAIIKISGREYHKNRTRVDVTLIIGEKLLEKRQINWSTAKSQIINISAQTVEEAFVAAENFNLRLNQ